MEKKTDDLEKQVEEEISEEVSENLEEKKDPQAELLEQIAGLKDTLLRKTAESENLRKRLEKEKDDAVKYANKSFARDLLAVLDNFERINKGKASVQNKIDSDPNLKAYFEGISICEKELLSTFQKYGVARVEVSVGDLFNHEFHQAMCEVEDADHPAGSVVKVFQTGYKYYDRLLRPAMVSVSKKA